MGICYWEMTFDNRTGNRIIFRSPYREQHDGFWLLWPDSSRFHCCKSVYDEVLAFSIDDTPWWMRRLSSPTPDLQYFIDTSCGELVDLLNHPSGVEKS